MRESEPYPGEFYAPSVEELQDLFPKLEILELIACGGMGAVYKARQPQLDRFVALKILPPSVGKAQEYAERFRREARAMAQLNHPGVVGIFDFGQAGDYFFFVMEYVDGFTLHELIRAGSLEPKKAFSLFLQVCAGLAYAHEKGVVHLDIKPGNIMLDKEGRAKILDFGLASLRRGGETDGAKEDMGTPDYAAPERFGSDGIVDHRADIYSLGVVLYETLVGKVPKGEFAAASTLSEVDPAVDEVIENCLAPDPEDRYGAVQDLSRAVSASRRARQSVAGKKEREGDARPVKDLAAEKRREVVLSRLKWRLGILLVLAMLVGAGAFLFRDKIKLEFRKKQQSGAISGGKAGDQAEEMKTRLEEERAEKVKEVAPIVAEEKRVPDQKVKALSSEQTFTNGVGIEMIRVPEGSFRMGDLSGNQRENESPVHSVELSGYYLAATELTEGQWKSVMGRMRGDERGDRYPHDRVSWEAAMKFCRKLTEDEQAAGRLPEGYVYTLPTEAQWEHACRAGTESDYAGNLDALAWYADNSAGESHPVAGKQPNAWGFFDLHGNVSEWCLDHYAEKYPQDGALGHYGKGRLRVQRGGSWNDEGGRCRSAARTANRPAFRGAETGFRPCLTRAELVPLEQVDSNTAEEGEVSDEDEMEAEESSSVSDVAEEEDKRVDEATLEVPAIALKRVARLVGHEGAVHAVAVSPDAPFVVTGGADATLRIWQSVTGVLLQTLAARGPVAALSFSQDGRFLAVAGEASPEIAVWSMADRQVIRKVGSGLGRGIRDLVFLADGRSVAALHVFEDGQTDTAVIVWDLSSMKIRSRYDIRRQGMDSLAWTETGAAIVASSTRKGVVCVVPGERKVLWERDDLQGAVSVSPDGSVAHVGNQTVLMDGGVNAHEELRVRNNATALASDAGGRGYYALGLEYGKVLLRDAGNGAAIVVKQEYDGHCLAVAFYPGGNGLITGGEDGRASIWEIVE